jgi:hypothetical protein
VEGGIFQPYDFLTAESLGTDLPRRCTSCRRCKECKFRTDSLTFKEDQEYQVILEGLKFDEECRRWRATYPFHIPPTTLRDNYQQVYKYTLAQEKRLAKQGRTEEFNTEFYKTVELGVFKEITKEEVRGKPMLLIFRDGSTLASCALAYLRWQMADGTVQCKLLAGKTRVAPKCKISIPRMELMGALLAVRLSRKIQDALQMELEAVRYFTDSAVVLGMILRESATYQEFVGTRVSEIRTSQIPRPSGSGSRAR